MHMQVKEICGLHLVRWTVLIYFILSLSFLLHCELAFWL